MVNSTLERTGRIILVLREEHHKTNNTMATIPVDLKHLDINFKNSERFIISRILARTCRLAP